jgi:sigma-E factor negative regulatory protein RseC
MPSREPVATPSGVAPADPAVCLGRVVAVDNGQATVELSDPGECASCASKGHCHLKPESNRQVVVAAAGFQVGDRVRVVASSGDILRASCVLYAIPTLLIVAGAFAGFFVGPEFLRLSSDLGSTLGVVVGIVVSLVFIHFYQGRRAAPVVRLERID